VKTELNQEFWDKYTSKVSEAATTGRMTSSALLRLSSNLIGNAEVSWREVLAIDLLIDAIKALENQVSKKRGAPTVVSIRAVAARRGINILAMAEALELLKAQLAPKKRGPQPAPRERGKPGAPRKWTLLMYRSILAWRDRGAETLKRQGKRVTNVQALKEAMRAENADLPARERPPQHEIDWLARDAARRISDARRALQK